MPILLGVDDDMRMQWGFKCGCHPPTSFSVNILSPWSLFLKGIESIKLLDSVNIVFTVQLIDLSNIDYREVTLMVSVR